MQSCVFALENKLTNLTDFITFELDNLCQPIVNDYCYHLRQNFNQIYPVKEWKEEGYFEDEDLMDIHCHWLQFEPVRPFVHFSLAILYVIFFIVGFLSNALVIFIILRYKNV